MNRTRLLNSSYGGRGGVGSGGEGGGVDWEYLYADPAFHITKTELGCVNMKCTFHNFRPPKTYFRITCEDLFMRVNVLSITYTVYTPAVLLVMLRWVLYWATAALHCSSLSDGSSGRSAIPKELEYLLEQNPTSAFRSSSFSSFFLSAFSFPPIPSRE